MRQLQGYVLAGGRSSRMGRDKAFVRLNGKELIGLAVERLTPMCEDVAILSGPASSEREALLSCHARLVGDEVGHEGPLAGVLGALRDAREWVVIVPVDQPLLPPEVFRGWLSWADSAADKASWMVAGEGAVAHVEPVPLLAHVSLLRPLERQFRDGERRVQHAVRTACQELGSTVSEFHVPVAEAGTWFLNLNTPAELDCAERRVRHNLANQTASGASDGAHE